MKPSHAMSLPALARSRNAQRPAQCAHKFLGRGDRTVDQMIQAARFGKKNLLEGSKAGRTSKETELKLTNVARASLEGLLDD